jgi:choline transport protein
MILTHVTAILLLVRNITGLSWSRLKNTNPSLRFCQFFFDQFTRAWTDELRNAWVSTIGWWLGSGSVSNFVASMILDIAAQWHPDYEPQRWQQYLVYVALIWLAVALNVFTSSWVPIYNKLIFILSAFTLSATTITLFVTARNNHTSAEFIFTDTTNRSGWSSNGWAFMIAIGNAVFSYLGSDCGAHMCEEIPNPGANVPKVILFPLVIGFITSFPFAAALLYSSIDIQGVLNTATGLPLLEIYYQGTGSKVGSSVLLAMFAFCFFGCLVANGNSLDDTYICMRLMIR